MATHARLGNFESKRQRTKHAPAKDMPEQATLSDAGLKQSTDKRKRDEQMRRNSTVMSR
jgi:hypothetical protein